MLKIDKSLDKPQSDNEQDEHKDGDESSQQALLSENVLLITLNLVLFPNYLSMALSDL